MHLDPPAGGVRLPAPLRQAPHVGETSITTRTRPASALNAVRNGSEVMLSLRATQHPISWRRGARMYASAGSPTECHCNPHIRGVTFAA